MRRLAIIACTVECVASKSGFLTADQKLDKAAITKFFAPYAVAFGAAIIHDTIEKCVDSYDADEDSSLACKSGALEFYSCFYRERFLNCPDSLWRASPTCEELKDNISECAKRPILINAGRKKRSFDMAVSKFHLLSLHNFKLPYLVADTWPSTALYEDLGKKDE